MEQSLEWFCRRMKDLSEELRYRRKALIRDYGTPKMSGHTKRATYYLDNAMHELLAARVAMGKEAQKILKKAANNFNNP
jgi:hypothetical protein